MPMTRIEWAVARDGPEYHSVLFRPGPNVHEEYAACGKVARFWPRIGIRMDDPYCPECYRIVADLAEREATLSRGGESASSEYDVASTGPETYTLAAAQNAALETTRVYTLVSVQDLLNKMMANDYDHDDLNRRAVLYLIEDGRLVIDRERRRVVLATQQPTPQAGEE